MSYSHETNVRLQNLHRLQQQARHGVPIGDEPTGEQYAEEATRWIWFGLGAIFAATLCVVASLYAGTSLPFCTIGQAQPVSLWASAQSFESLVWHPEPEARGDAPIVRVCMKTA